MLAFTLRSLYKAAIFIITFCPTAQTFSQPHLDSLFENPAIQEINRMPMRASYFAYENSKLAAAGDTEPWPAC